MPPVEAEQVRALAEAVAAYDGVAAFSEQTLLNLTSGRQVQHLGPLLVSANSNRLDVVRDAEDDNRRMQAKRGVVSRAVSRLNELVGALTSRPRIHASPAIAA